MNSFSWSLFVLPLIVMTLWQSQWKLLIQWPYPHPPIFSSCPVDLAIIVYIWFKAINSLQFYVLKLLLLIMMNNLILQKKLWCGRRLLRVPWTAKRSNQSVLKEINPGYSFQGLTLKLQYFGHLMQRADSLEKTPMLGKIEGRRKRGWQRMRQLDSITDSVDVNLNKPWEIVKDRGTWHAAVHGVTKSQTRLSNWTTKIKITFMNATMNAAIKSDEKFSRMDNLDHPMEVFFS